MRTGPLANVKIIEMAGIGPGPFCAMLLADMGADVLRIDRKGSGGQPVRFDILRRGRRSVALDLKKPEAIEACLSLVGKADALLEGFRPGVMERLGLGPDVCLARNSRLVYGRMTGWGQHGPLSRAAGHDINYIALTGALHASGRRGQGPVPSLNLVGDFGGGALYLAMGVCAALFEARGSGAGQVVDCAMTDGSASLMSMFYGMKASGLWMDERGVNLIDTGAHFYDVYETSDGKWIALGSIEPQFYAEMREKLGLSGDASLDAQMDRTRWPEMKKTIAAAIKGKTRAEWCALMEGSDVCFAPVLSLEEAPDHPHNAARETFVEQDGIIQPGPAPRFSRTHSRVQGPPPSPGQHTREALADWGLDASAVATLETAGAI